MTNNINNFTTNAVDKESNSISYYTIMGSQDFLDENEQPRCTNETSKNIFAIKTIRDDGSIKYTIKLDNRGKMYNPLSIYGESQASSFLDRVCRSNNKYKEVNQKSFEMYLYFLKTKNIAWLHNAERVQ